MAVKLAMIGSKNSSREELAKAKEASVLFLSTHKDGWLVSGHAVGVGNTAELAAMQVSGLKLYDKAKNVDWKAVKEGKHEGAVRIISYLPDVSPDFYDNNYLHPKNKAGKEFWPIMLPVDFNALPSTMGKFPTRFNPNQGVSLTSLLNPEGKTSKLLIRSMAQVLGTGKPEAIVNGVAYCAKPSIAEENGEITLNGELVRGETGQAVRLAMFLGIPCWNLSDQKQYAEFMETVQNGNLPAQRELRDGIKDVYTGLEGAFIALNRKGIKIESYEDIMGKRLRGFFKNDGNLRLEDIPEEELSRLVDYTPFAAEGREEKWATRTLYSIHKGEPIVSSLDVKMEGIPAEQLGERLQQTIEAMVARAEESGQTEKRFYGLKVLDVSQLPDALKTANISLRGDGVSFDDFFKSENMKFKKDKEANGKYLKPASIYHNFLYISALIKHFAKNPKDFEMLSQYNAFTDAEKGARVNDVTIAEAMNLYFWMNSKGLINEVFNQKDPNTGERLRLSACYDKFRDVIIENYYLPKLKRDSVDKLWDLYRRHQKGTLTDENYKNKCSEQVAKAMEFARGLGVENPDEKDFRPAFNHSKGAAKKAEEYSAVFEDGPSAAEDYSMTFLDDEPAPAPVSEQAPVQEAPAPVQEAPAAVPSTDGKVEKIRSSKAKAAVTAAEPEEAGEEKSEKPAAKKTSSRKSTAAVKGISAPAKEEAAAESKPAKTGNTSKRRASINKGGKGDTGLPF